MKNISIYLTTLFLSFAMPQIQAQEITSKSLERLEQERQEIIPEEKASLKETMESINERLEHSELSKDESMVLKEQAAKKHALNIENRIAILENEIAWITRNEEVEDENESYNKRMNITNEDDEDNWNDERNRTTKNLVLAVGFNNALESGQSINDSDFKLAGSRFFELGVAWRTRVFENSNWLRIRYGVSFQFNGLKPTDNRYFVEEGDMTILEEYPLELNKSKFRMDNLVVPFHFEFGPSKKVEYDRGTWFSTHNKLKIGLGGFAGFNIGERQKLKYKEDGEKVKRKLKDDYNTNDFVYGLSGYLGWGDSTLYVKYDLNPIFQAPNPELHNISVGLRFDVD